ncbi:transmembrane protein 119b [Lampris incognitus]|uniref:transmembrane protein 119b n=1 Tax=Lampris incognitus TaxID=2546036 RepID=UPI0024B4A675|nr:transmembrane protein 119b [Lampris incognitus]
MFLVALHLTSLSVILWPGSSVGTPHPFQISLEGSGDGEENSNLFPTLSSLATRHPAMEYNPKHGGRSNLNTEFLNQVVKFLQENLFLIVVGATLLIIVFLIIIGAVLIHCRHKVNAYYPSSFPSKMYVDQRDKTGGTKPFMEVPEKISDVQESEEIDAGKKLQADIMRAAKGLRTLNKLFDPYQKTADEDPEDTPGKDDSIPDKRMSDLHDHKEVCQPSDNEAAALTSKLPEQAHLEEEEEEESDVHPADAGPSLGPQSHRPLSQHIYSDSAKLQLITGEKTAF